MHARIKSGDGFSVPTPGPDPLRIICIECRLAPSSVSQGERSFDSSAEGGSNQIGHGEGLSLAMTVPRSPGGIWLSVPLSKTRQLASRRASVCCAVTQIHCKLK